MSVWKDIVARQLRALHVDTIRGKILVFGLLATLVPTLATTLVSYTELKQSLSQQVTEQLRGVSAEAARQLDQWLDERLHDLRVAASSYEVAENLARIQGSGGGQAIGRVRDHLNSLRGRLPDHEALLVDDARGRVVTSSGGRLSGVQPPPDKLNGLRTAELFLGDPYWDAGLAKAALVLAVPIRQAADGRFLGVLAAKVNLRSVTDILQRLAPGEGGLGEGGGGDVYLMTDQGRLIMRSRVSSADLMRAKLPAPTTQALFDREGTAVVYKRADGREVVGTLRRVPLLRWAAVAELPQAEALRPLARLRNATTLLLVALLAALGLMAYVLGLLIVRPLERLASAAAKLVAGDLSVELPVGGSGEVGSLTQAFRTLAGRLREREGQGELERLSVTDALTGLYNRRHLMGTLANEVQRSHQAHVLRAVAGRRSLQAIQRHPRPPRRGCGAREDRGDPAEDHARGGLRGALRRRGVPGDVARDDARDGDHGRGAHPGARGGRTVRGRQDDGERRRRRVSVAWRHAGGAHRERRCRDVSGKRRRSGSRHDRWVEGGNEATTITKAQNGLATTFRSQA